MRGNEVMNQHEREQLIKDAHELLDGRRAHLHFDDAVLNFPSSHYGSIAPGVEKSAWQLVEHLRICLWDIVEFCRSAAHVSPKFPDGYWPTSPHPEHDHAWEQSIKSYRQWVTQLLELIDDPTSDLLKPLPHGTGQTLYAEVLLAADHQAYHVGQLVYLRKQLGIWNAH